MFTVGHPWRFSSAVTRYLSQSAFGHVLAGDTRGMIDSQADGDKIRDFQRAFLIYPLIVTTLEIPCAVAPDPRQWRKPPRRGRFWRSLARFVFRASFIRVDDCVQRVAEYVRASGIDLPPVYSPQDIYEALRPIAADEHVADKIHNCIARERERIRGVAKAAVSAPTPDARDHQRPARFSGGIRQEPGRRHHPAADRNGDKAE